MKRLRQFEPCDSLMSLIAAIAFGVILFTEISAFHPPEASALTGKEESVSESMRDFSKQIIAAYERRDPKALKNFYAKQPDALFFWERKMSYSWPQIENTLEALVSAVTKLKLTTREFRSGGSGNTGWFAATFHVERVTPEGKEVSSEGRWTVVAEKVNGKWLIVHEHTSFPLPER